MIIAETKGMMDDHYQRAHLAHMVLNAIVRTVRTSDPFSTNEKKRKRKLNTPVFHSCTLIKSRYINRTHFANDHLYRFNAEFDLDTRLV